MLNGLYNAGDVATNFAYTNDGRMFVTYKGGVVSLIEVLDADANLLQVRDAKAQAQTEAARAAVASFRALGGGWDAPNASGSNGLYSNLSSSDRR